MFATRNLLQNTKQISFWMPLQIFVCVTTMRDKLAFSSCAWNKTFSWISLSISVPVIFSRKKNPQKHEGTYVRACARAHTRTYILAFIFLGVLSSKYVCFHYLLSVCISYTSLCPERLYWTKKKKKKEKGVSLILAESALVTTHENVPISVSADILLKENSRSMLQKLVRKLLSWRLSAER